MRSETLITSAIACSVAFLCGCWDPRARTAYSVLPAAIGISHSQVEHAIDIIVETVAQDYQLHLIEKRLDEKGQLRDKTYVHLRLGENPTLYMTVFFAENPIRVEVEERYISRPTSKHRKLVRDLKSHLEQAGLQATKVDACVRRIEVLQ